MSCFLMGPSGKSEGLLENQLYATVLRPGAVGSATYSRLLFSVAYGFHLATGSPVHSQETLDSIGTALTKGQVVLLGTAVIGVAFQANLLARVVGQVAGVSNQHVTGFLLDFGSIEIEVEGSDFTQGLLLGLLTGSLALFVAQNTGGNAIAIVSAIHRGAVITADSLDVGTVGFVFHVFAGGATACYQSGRKYHSEHFC